MDTKHRILLESLRLFSQRGYDAVGMDHLRIPFPFIFKTRSRMPWCLKNSRLIIWLKK